MPKNARTIVSAASVFFLSAALLLFALLTPACASQKSENVLTGYDLDTEQNKPRRLSSQFKAGEPFSIVLKPVQFRDTFVELIIYSYDKDKKAQRVRNISLSGIDMDDNFLQIGDVFQLPFPGRYRISFEQLGSVLGWAEVEIIP